MRGKVSLVNVSSVNMGITPAYAGKRRKLRRTAPRSEDHPRVCGEKARNRYDSATYKGSPPRMRGKEVGLGVRTPRIGITPAYAGKSRTRPSV